MMNNGWLREDLWVIHLDCREGLTLEHKLVAQVENLPLQSGRLGDQILDTDRAAPLRDTHADNVELEVPQEIIDETLDDGQQFHLIDVLRSGEREV